MFGVRCAVLDVWGWSCAGIEVWDLGDGLRIEGTVFGVWWLVCGAWCLGLDVHRG